MRINKFLYFVLMLFIFMNCGGSSSGATEDLSEIDTIVPIDSVQLKKDLEKARMDSIREVALKGDSLREMHIVVDKQNCYLFLREDGKSIMEVPVCVGKGIGQKQRLGDHKTPEGVYKVKSIENSSSWPHDFRDGKGKVLGAYGPWFFRLNTPQSTHIGIHGTNLPETMGMRDSDGCIRLRNEDLEQLKQYVKVGMTVIINPDKV